jgi:hypothetical protein
MLVGSSTSATSTDRARHSGYLFASLYQASTLTNITPTRQTRLAPTRAKGSIVSCNCNFRSYVLQVQHEHEFIRRKTLLYGFHSRSAPVWERDARSARESIARSFFFRSPRIFSPSRARSAPPSVEVCARDVDMYRLGTFETRSCAVLRARRDRSQSRLRGVATNDLRASPPRRRRGRSIRVAAPCAVYRPVIRIQWPCALCGSRVVCNTSLLLTTRGRHPLHPLVSHAPVFFVWSHSLLRGRD